MDHSKLNKSELKALKKLRSRIPKILAPYKGLTKTGFTFEMSDHLPLWAQLNVDVEDEQLDQLISRHRK